MIRISRDECTAIARACAYPRDDGGNFGNFGGGDVATGMGEDKEIPGKKLGPTWFPTPGPPRYATRGIVSLPLPAA
jgi:hypothetical protein